MPRPPLLPTLAATLAAGLAVPLFAEPQDEAKPPATPTPAVEPAGADGTTVLEGLMPPGALDDYLSGRGATGMSSLRVVARGESDSILQWLDLETDRYTQQSIDTTEAVKVAAQYGQRLRAGDEFRPGLRTDAEVRGTTAVARDELFPLLRRRAELLEKYGERHLEVVRVDRQIEAMRKHLSEITEDAGGATAGDDAKEWTADELRDYLLGRTPGVRGLRVKSSGPEWVWFHAEDPDTGLDRKAGAMKRAAFEDVTERFGLPAGGLGGLTGDLTPISPGPDGRTGRPPRAWGPRDFAAFLNGDKPWVRELRAFPLGDLILFEVRTDDPPLRWDAALDARLAPPVLAAFGLPPRLTAGQAVEPPAGDTAAMYEAALKRTDALSGLGGRQLGAAQRTKAPTVDDLAAAAARAGGDARTAYRDRLETALADRFDAAQKERGEDLAALEAKVKRLRELHDKRAAAKDEIVARRAEALLRAADGLGWDEPARGRGFGGFETVDVPAGGFGGDAPFGGFELVDEPAGGFGGPAILPPGFGSGGGGFGGPAIDPQFRLGGGGFGGGDPDPAPGVEWDEAPITGTVRTLGRRPGEGGGPGERWAQIHANRTGGVRIGDLFEIRGLEPGDAPGSVLETPIARLEVKAIENFTLSGPLRPVGETDRTAEVRPGDRVVRVEGETGDGEDEEGDAGPAPALPVQGLIVASRGVTVQIARGYDDGLRYKDELDLFAAGEPVGRVRVDRVDDGDAEGLLTEGDRDAVVDAMKARTLTARLPLETAAADGVRLLFFTADGSGPDAKIRPFVDSLVEDGEPVTVVDTAERPDVMKRYDVTGVPTFVLEVGGREVWRGVGVPGGDAKRLAGQLRSRLARAKARE